MTSAADMSRRILLTRLCGAFVSGSAMLAYAGPLSANERYRLTLQVLAEASRVETKAYHRYVAFARKAKADDYRGVAYFFIALATSELIHAQNYNTVQSSLGREVNSYPMPEIKLGETKSNLIAAAKAEINTIDNVYPDVVDKLSREGNKDAIEKAQYALKSHRQHKALIEKILAYAPIFFETVARRIDESSNQFFVCQICGSTVDAVPEKTCPICGYATLHYRAVDRSTFMR